MLLVAAVAIALVAPNAISGIPNLVFATLNGLHPLLQAVLVVVAFIAAIALMLLLIGVVGRGGRGATLVRLAVVVVAPAVVLFLFNSVVWAVIVAALVGTLLFWIDARSSQGAGYLIQLMGFLAPAVLLLVVGLILPSLQTIGASFMNRTGTDFVGLENFVWIFTQPAGIRAVVNTIIWPSSLYRS